MTAHARYPGPGRLLRRCLAHEDGVALIEFALVFPVLVALFLGLVEFGEAFSVSRKVDNVAATTADLVSQLETLTDADFNDIVKVADELIKPYSSAPMAMVVSSVVADENNNTKVAWSCTTGGATARAVDSPVTLANDGLTEPGSSLILVEASYQFTPTVGLYLLGTHDLKASAFFRPRLMKTIPIAAGACGG
jgi:Flp pilus assembly protein TadG